jgi:hypothetical protein
MDITPDAKMVYFVLETQRDKNGWIPLIAVENESGFYKTDWRWDCTFEEADAMCDERNTTLGFTKKEAMMIQLSTMRAK